MKPRDKIAHGRYYRNGRVALLVSPGWGAGWTTWADYEAFDRIAWDPMLVAAVLAGDADRIRERAHELARECEAHGLHVYVSPNLELEIHWLDPGDIFNITSHDGNEWVDTPNQDWRTA